MWWCVIEDLNDVFIQVSKLGDIKGYVPRKIDIDQFLIDDSEYDKDIILDAGGYKTNYFSEHSDGDFPIVGVDVSSIKLGDLFNGYLACYRVAIVIQGSLMKSLVYGPYIVNLSGENILRVQNILRKRLKLQPITWKKVPSGYKVVDRVRNYMERITQLWVTDLIEDGVILWDGSLMGGTVDTPKSIVKRTIKKSVRKGNDVIGISKMSTIRDIDGNRLVNLIPMDSEACYIDVYNRLTPGIKEKCLGHVFIVKFREGGPSFRVDIYPAKGDAVDALQRLYSSRYFYRGYPDALRIAHLLAAFRRSEVVALQSIVLGSLRLEEEEFDIRKYVLSPFE